MPKLYDGNGKEWKGDPMGALADLGIKTDGDNLIIERSAMRRMREKELRKIAVSQVPNTPRWMTRDAGGIAVSKGQGRWPHMTMDMLRDLRERAPILQVIHSARQYQIRRMSRKWNGQRGEVGWEVVHRDHNDQNRETPEGFERWTRKFESMLESPSPTYRVRTTGSMLALLWEDLATINRPVVEIIHSAIDPRRVVQFRPVDGALIWETMQWMEVWQQTNPHWHGGWDPRKLALDDQLSMMSAAYDMELNGIEYVLVQDNQILNGYPRNKLIVAPLQNRTDVRWSGYPPSHVEQAVHLVAAFISSFDYNASLFTRGMMAEAILGLPGDMHDDDVDAFVDMLRESTQGVANAHQMPILPLTGDAKIEKIDLKQTNKDMMFEVFLSLLTSLTSAVYRMDDSTINGKPWGGGAGAPLSEGNREKEISLAKEEGLQGDLQWLTDEIIQPIAQRCHPDLRVKWHYGDFDATKEANLYEVRTRTDMGRNESRIEQGRESWGFYLTPKEYNKASEEDQKKHDGNIWNWTTDDAFVTAMTQRAMADQMAENPGMMPGQDPGQSDGDGFGGQDDGFGQPAAAQPATPFGSPQDLAKGTVTVIVQETP